MREEERHVARLGVGVAFGDVLFDAKAKTGSLFVADAAGEATRMGCGDDVFFDMP